MIKVLIGCAFSGIVREEFKKRGHNAWSCDLLPTKIPGQHIQGDVLKILNDSWDLLIAFPPCTHLSVSGAAHFKQKITDGRQQKAIDFFMKLANAPIDKICIENPVCIMSTKWRKPDQIIQPYYFGNNTPKKTCLWLKNLPQLMWYKKNELFKPTEVKPEYLLYNSKKTKSGKSRYSKFGKLGKGCGKERSIFFPAVAKAMAEQWG